MYDKFLVGSVSGPIERVRVVGTGTKYVTVEQYIDWANMALKRRLVKANVRLFDTELEAVDYKASIIIAQIDTAKHHIATLSETLASLKAYRDSLTVGETK